MKKKLTAVALVVCMLAVMLVGASLAYFTDNKTVVNTFTAGKVAITLDEAKVVKAANGDLVAAKKDNEDCAAGANDEVVRTSGKQEYKLYPGMTVTKDPTITVVDGSEDCYIAAKITIKGDLLTLYGADKENNFTTYTNLDITKFVSGGLIQENSEQSNNWNGLSMIFTDNAGNVYYQDASKGNQGANSEWVIYVFIKDVKKAGETIKLFETINVDPKYNNAEMAKLNNATVTVEAYAVQEYGMTKTTDGTYATDCFNAMTKAFADKFPAAE